MAVCLLIGLSLVIGYCNKLYGKIRINFKLNVSLFLQNKRC